MSATQPTPSASTAVSPDDEPTILHTHGTTNDQDNDQDDTQPAHVSTYVNYCKDPPTTQPSSALNQEHLSTHAIRLLRRKDDAPDISPTPVLINNIRAHDLSSFSLDKQGFQISHLESGMTDWTDDAMLKTIYFAEVSDLLKKVTGAKYVHSYEHHVRTKTLAEALSTETGEGDVDIAGPVRRVHIDETPKSARKEFAHYLPQFSGDGSRSFGIYNVWKSLKVVRRDPLCVMDARTLNSGDLKVGAVTVPNMGEIENFSVRAPPEGEEGRHGFWFLRGQKVEEALVFRIFDGRDEGLKGVAHTSFVDGEFDKPGVEARSSVEVRSFCVF